MQIEQQQLGEVKVIKPVGELTGDGATVLSRRVTDALAESPGPMVIDASQITGIDSRGLEALVDARQELVKHLQVLRIAGAREVLREVLTLTDLRNLFEHFDDVGAAVRSNPA